MFKNAKWIWDKDNKRLNDWVSFKKSFNVEKRATYILKISAETRYHLWINGQTVVLDGSLLRDAYEENSGFYDNVNISDFVKIGQNEMEILVWHWGNGGRNNNPHEYGGLIFECEKLNLYSDKTTLCARSTAYKTSDKGEQPSYLYGGFNIVYDANEKEPTFQNATEFDSSLFGKLYERPVPLFRFSEVITSKYTKKGNKYTVKLPEPHHIMPTFKVEANGGEVIDIRTDRYNVNGGPGDHFGSYNGHRTEYICKKGMNEFLSLDWFACEEIIFTIPKGVTIHSLGYRISEYDADFMQILTTGDKLIDKLMKKCVTTLKFCMRDNFMDCPDRERGQWIGDICVQTPQVFYALDHKAIPLLKKAILNFIHLRKGDVLVGNVPGINFCELPAQSLNAISDIGMIREYYNFTGEKEVLDISFVPAINYLKLWNMAEDGLVEKRTGDWYWSDHLNNCDNKVMENCWYYLALKFAKFMANELNNHSFDDFILSRMKSIEENFDKNFWGKVNVGNFYTSIDGLTDERANALAVLAGLASPDKYIHIKDILISTFNCSTYMEGYVCEALCIMGYKEFAYKRIISRYYNLIENENGTLWEDFYILGTKNHAWSGSPLTFIYKYFVGISSDDFMKTIKINPDFKYFKRYKFSLDVGGKTISVYATKNNIEVDNKSDSKVVVYKNLRNLTLSDNSFP